MKICKITRPPADPIHNKYMGVSRGYLYDRLTSRGYRIEQLYIKPLNVPNVYLSFMFGFLFAALRFRRDDYDLILTNNIESALTAHMIKRIFNIPFVFEFIDDYVLIAGYSLRRFKKMRVDILKRLERRLPGFADMIIVNNDEMRMFCLKNGISEHRLRFIPNGVDTNLFVPEEKCNDLFQHLRLSNAQVVLFRGKMNRYYKIEIILEAIPLVLATFPDTKFVFVGDGDNMEHILYRVRQLHIGDAVIFTGFQPQKQLVKYINIADICLCSLPNSSALSLLEYAACGKPVIMPRGGTEKIGTDHELVREGCVLLVDHSPAGFAQGIKKLLHQESLCRDMGHRGRRIVSKSYTWDIMAGKYEETFEEVSKRDRINSLERSE